MFAKIIWRRKPQSGGLRVTRRGRRKYVVIPPYGAEPRKAEAFDWRKPGNAPEGKEGAWSVGNREG